MHKNLSLPSKTAWSSLALALAFAGSARADFDPIPLTPDSFTHDMVVENTAPPPLNVLVTATMDGGTNNNGWTWFERGYLTNLPSAGLPAPGATFSPPSDSTRLYKMAGDYTKNNALLVYTNGSPSGTLTFKTPAAYSLISAVVTSAGGYVTNLIYTITFQGGATESGSMTVPDWFNDPNEIALQAGGRINMDNGQLGELNGTNPRLYYKDIYLFNTTTPITQITFQSTNSQRAAVLAMSGWDGAGYTPIDLDGFNRDMVIEKSAMVCGTVQNRVTATMDGGSASVRDYTWYEKGFNTNAPATGLPAAGSQLVVGGTNTFNMPASYVGNNCLYIANFGSFTSGALTLNTPAAYRGLSFLTAAGNGPLNMTVTVTHDDFQTEQFTVSALDWFNQTSGQAYTAAGRVRAHDMAFDQVNGTNPRLYVTNIVLAISSPVTQISFTYLSGGRGPIFAVSGQTTDGGTFSPVGVSGFNADVVVEALPTYPVYGIQSYTTASMDGGVNNTGNTWHERGLYPQFPQSGLPPAGTVITSLAKDDHHYQMPATYVGKNVAFVDSVRSNVNLTLANPAAYSALSFLSATANNNVTNQVIIQFQDGTSETNTYVSRDWFNNTPFAFTARGRVNLMTRVMNNAHTDNPRLYEAEFALANTVSPVTNIVLNFLGAVNPTTGRMAVLAVSATAGAVRPIISAMPASFQTIEGSNVVLAATIGGGTQPIAYQWYIGTNGAFSPMSSSGTISGVTTPTLQINPIGWTNVADYLLVAENIAGRSTSAVTRISAVYSGLPDVTIPGDPIAVYQPNGGQAPPAAEGPEHAIDDLTSKYLNRGSGLTPYSGPGGFIVSPPRPGTIVNVLRFYTANDVEGRDPADYLLEGSRDGGVNWATIGSGPLALPAARNAAALALNPLTVNMQEIRLANTAGYTSYRMSFNTVKGNEALLQIGEVEILGLPDPASVPTIILQPADLTANEGSTVKFRVSAVGPGTLSYQWYDVTMGEPGNIISGQTTDTLTLTSITASMTGNRYRVAVINANGPVYSTAAQLTVQSGQPVVVTDLPIEDVVYLGRTAVLPVTISGTEPFTMQWQKDAGNLADNGRISGSKSNILTISNSQMTDAGNYQLATIQNTLGTAQSAMQALTVQKVPALTPNGAGWVLNGNISAPVVSMGVLALADGTGSSARSAWYKYPLYVGAFKASFVYQDVGGGGADGIAFVLQRDPRGTNALGGAGGALAYSGITPSVALQFNIYNTSGFAFNTNGATGNYLGTDGVDLRGGDPIKADIQYANGVLWLALSNTATAATFSTNLFVGDLVTRLGGDLAWVGFTGATGGTVSTQNVSEFQYIPVPPVSVRTSGTSLVLSWPASVGGYKLQSSTGLTSGWADANVNEILVGQEYEVTIPAPLNNTFYRLVLK